MSRANGPGQSTRLLLDIVDVLNRERTNYAVIGAVAAAVHGVVRASLDADAVVSLSVSELSRLQRALAPLGLCARLRRGDSDDPVPGMLVLEDEYGNRVDLLAGIRGMDPAVYSRGIELQFEGGVLKIIGREDFIAMKIYAGGPQDLIDASHAIAVSKSDLDTELLRRLARRFGSETAETCERLLAAAP